MENSKIRAHPPWYARGTPVTFCLSSRRQRRRDLSQRKRFLSHASFEMTVNKECMNEEMRECVNAEMHECRNSWYAACNTCHPDDEGRGICPNETDFSPRTRGRNDRNGGTFLSGKKPGMGVVCGNKRRLVSVRSS